MNRVQHLPNRDRLSVLVAIILLALALAKFIDIPSQVFTYQIPGLFLRFELSLKTSVTVLVTAMAASGAAWLLSQHPKRSKNTLLPHLLLPAFTTWVAEVALDRISLSAAWWVAFGISGLMIMLVMMAEYISLDPQDIRSQLVEPGLIALTYALFFVFAVSLKILDLRLYLILPGMILAAGMVSLRILNLHLKMDWPIAFGLVPVVVVAQFATAFHYLPMTPMAFGLILLGLLYAVIIFLSGYHEGQALGKITLQACIGLIASLVLVLLAGR